MPNQKPTDKQTSEAAPDAAFVDFHSHHDDDAAEYIVRTDHRIGCEDKDSYIRLSAKCLKEAMSESISITRMDRTLFCLYLYQLDPDSCGTIYWPIATKYLTSGFYTNQDLSRFTSHHLVRHVDGDKERYDYRV